MYRLAGAVAHLKQGVGGHVAWLLLAGRHAYELVKELICKAGIDLAVRQLGCFLQTGNMLESKLRPVDIDKAFQA